MAKDHQIRLLSLHIANKIAAGEVVERPSAVVKELLENALDAGATRIAVNITAGGRKLIAVRDNGHGMGSDDALLALERQATSKIRDVGDIEKIATLGFRGEALPSIASVSRFTLRTRLAEADCGSELTVNGGTLRDVRAVGMPAGTTVEVRDLFFNVPARRKFLRAFQTEQAHIKSVFTLHALAHPAVGMSLSADGRELLQLPPSASLAERVTDIFGIDFQEALIPLDKTAGSLRVHGFIGTPGRSRSDRSEQYIFVNRRPATAAIIAYALRQAYPALEGERKPIALLFIELPPEDVDVNVHPTKREVRFQKPAQVRELLLRAIEEVLQPGQDSSIPPPASLRYLEPCSTGAAHGDMQTGEPLQNSAAPPYTPSFTPPPAESAPLFTPPATSSTWSDFRIIGSLNERYLLLETENGLVILDPRAARERVLYERLLELDRRGERASQPLLLPESILLPAADAARLRQYLDVMRTIGFEIADFGNDHFIVEALPSLLGPLACRELLADIACDIEHAGVQRGAERWRTELIAKALSRASARCSATGDEAGLRALINDLTASRMPYTCPRGRPTMFLTSYRELERKFGR